jgi:glycine cleavage system T protein (aminomethyltransferase)
VSPAEQHLATRRAAGLFDFSFMGLYEFSETPALDRLQTRRLTDIAPGQAAYTLLLNEDGSVFNDATVWNMGSDRWWLFTGRRSDFGWIRARADARDRSAEHAILALQGPLSGKILARLVGEEIVRRLKYFRFIQTKRLLVARLGYSGEIGYELLVPVAAEPGVRASLLDAGRADGLCQCTFEAADTLRIESGYVLFDREIDGRANPRELGLERLVNLPREFALSRKLIGIEILEGKAGMDLPVVAVTSECLSPTLGARIGLGFAAPEAGVGHPVRLEDGRAARIAPLPFYDRNRRR